MDNDASMDNDALTASEFQRTSDTQDWRVIGADALAWFPTASHAEGAALARRVLKDAGSLKGRYNFFQRRQRWTDAA